MSAQSGYVLFPGTNQAHGGSQSVELVTTNSSLNKSVSLYHQFPAATYGTASVWVYDTGADVSSANYITLSVSSGGAQVAGLGTWDYDLGPGDGGSTYTYGVGGSSAYTGIDRTRAWHQFTICCWASTLTLMIDGNVIYSGQGGRTFDRVGLYLGGPNWRPACSVQFDDFQFVSQPLQPSADIHMYAGVTVAGTVGAPYQIQYKANIKSTNWLGLTDLVLPASPYLFIDTTSPAAPQRLYRVLAQP